jgi:outer membrane protein assembly factor BamB
VKWSYTTGGNVSFSSPAVAGGVVYVGSIDGKVYALNAATGAVKWTYATISAVMSSPAVAGGVVYVGSDDQKVYALNAATGALDWSYTTGGNIGTSPAVADGVVYTGSSDGNVYAFGLSGGTTGDVRRPAPASLRPDRHLRP